MKKIILLSIISLFIFSSCENGVYGYNERFSLQKNQEQIQAEIQEDIKKQEERISLEKITSLKKQIKIVEDALGELAEIDNI